MAVLIRRLEIRTIPDPSRPAGSAVHLIESVIEGREDAMLGLRNVEGVQEALVSGPEPGATVAGAGAASCDPFYRAWLRSARRELARGALAGARASIDLAAPRGWVESGEWGDTSSADRDPDRAAHAEGHRSLKAQREQLLACHERGDLVSARSVHAALRHWGVEHVRGPDRALVLRLEASGGAR